MFLLRLIRKLWFLLFPVRGTKQTVREKTELRQSGQELFSEKRIRRIFPDLKIRRRKETGKWVIHAKNTVAPYLLFNLLPLSGKVTVRRTASNTQTSVSMDKEKCFLTIIEYVHPSKIRWNLSEKDEVLFARVNIESGKQTFEIADFYRTVDIYRKEKVRDRI
mgnify:CR=1 FL=1